MKAEIEELDAAEAPLVTAVISTRDRGGAIVETVRSVLLNDYPRFELRVVDQSQDERAETALRTFSGDSRFFYIRTATEGLSTGRNLGISSARGELIAITDDDCKVPTSWLRELVSAFAVDSRIGVVFGNVLPGPHDRAAGLVLSYVSRESFLAHSIREKHRVEGLGACMGLRRSVWQELDGFDQMLGAGAPLKSAEEADFAIRALLAGYYVYETPNLMVTHLGFRAREQSRHLIQGYLYGQGAMLVKHLRCQKWPIIRLLLRMARRWALERSAIDLGDRSHRVLRLASFIQGFAAGAAMAVDRTTGCFKPLSVKR